MVALISVVSNIITFGYFYREMDPSAGQIFGAVYSETAVYSLYPWFSRLRQW